MRPRVYFEDSGAGNGNLSLPFSNRVILAYSSPAVGQNPTNHNNTVATLTIAVGRLAALCRVRSSNNTVTPLSIAVGTDQSNTGNPYGFWT